MIFHLIATVSTDNSASIHKALKELIGANGTVGVVAQNERKSGGVGEFTVRADMKGESAKELNRELLSALRRVEKKTRLRAAWSSGADVEQFFDYVRRKNAPNH